MPNVVCDHSSGATAAYWEDVTAAIHTGEREILHAAVCVLWDPLSSFVVSFKRHEHPDVQCDQTMYTCSHSHHGDASPQEGLSHPWHCYLRGDDHHRLYRYW